MLPGGFVAVAVSEQQYYEARVTLSLPPRDNCYKSVDAAHQHCTVTVQRK